MSDGFLLSALELGGPPIVRGVKRLTLEMRVGTAVRRKLRRAGFTVHSKQLRLVMYQPGFAQRLAQQPRDGDELGRALATTITPATPAAIDLLRQTLVSAFRIRLEGSTASSEFREERAESRHDEVMSTFAAADESSWEARLGAMPPLRAEDLRDLRAQWPAATRLVADIATAPDRAALLQRWADYPSPFLDGAPPAVFGTLADIASELPGAEDERVAVRFIEIGLDRGMAPAGYWRLRLMSARGITTRPEADEFLSDVRGYPLVEATLREGGADAAIALLESWRPDSRREELNRRITLAKLYLGSRRLDEGVELARATAAEFDSTSAAMMAVRALLARQMVERSAANAADLSTALVMVMDARRKRRGWGLESGSALALEIRVRRALSDRQGVVDLVTGAGELPATPEEFQHPDVAAEAALFHAAFGDPDLARRLLTTAAPASREHIEAVLAEAEGRAEDAIEHWKAAIDAVDDWGEKADLALQLAFQGVRSEFLDQLGPENADAAREIGMVAALYVDEPGALETFRGFANANYRGTLFLFSYYKKRGDHAAAAALAREGAVRWGDPDLWVESARVRIANAQHVEAIADLQSALAVATDAWGGRADAYRLLVEAHSANGDWPEALIAAGRLLADRPSPGAAWAVIYCQVRTHDLPGALRTWRDQGGPEPQTEYEVGAWIELVTEYEDEVGTARDALRIAARFPTDERMRGALLGAFFFGRRPVQSETEGEESDEEETPDPDRDAFQEMLADYVRDFPDGAIQQVSVDLENPLQSMQDLVGDRPRHLELEEQILHGALPIGFASLLYGKRYLEVLLSREDGPVFSASRDFEAEKAAIAHAHEAGVVLDLSTLVTIGRLPETIRPLLIGHFANSRVLSEHHTDAAAAARVIRRDSGLSYRPGIDGEVGTVEQRDEESVEARTDLADRVAGSFAQFATDTHPSITAFEETSERNLDQIFLLAADHALASDLAFWVDDFALKELVRQRGGRAFGTPELLVHLHEEGSVNPALIDLAEAHLVAAGYVGVRFRAPVWELAAELAPTPLGIANAIKHAGTDDVAQRALFAMKMIEASTADPASLAQYVYAMAQWLISIAADERTAVRNIHLLAGDLLRRPWMNSSTLPYCLNAFRATTGAVDAVGLMLRGVYGYYERLAASVGHEEAAVAVFELVSRLDPPDAHRLRTAIISGAFE